VIRAVQNRKRVEAPQALVGDEVYEQIHTRSNSIRLNCVIYICCGSVFDPILWISAASVVIHGRGLYIGANVGYGGSNVDHSFTINALNVSTKPSGFIGGIYAGYNWQFGRIVAGVETDMAWANISDTIGRRQAALVGHHAPAPWLLAGGIINALRQVAG
jgi:hypothetical protein